jgi:hypothetical protein
MKFITVLVAPSLPQRDAFQQWFVETFLPRLRADAPTLCGHVHRLAVDSPGTFFDAPEHAGTSICDVLLETWFSSAEDFRREVLPLHALAEAAGGRCISYHVTPRIQLDGRVAEAGPQGQPPEITAICAIGWKKGIGKAEASERYNRHAAIALRCQKTMTRYEQNIVEEVLGWSQGMEPVDALADFSFRTVEDCRTGLFAMPEELQDTSGYIGAGRFFYMGDAQTG